MARKAQEVEINMAITTSSKFAMVDVRSMTNETRLGIERFKYVLQAITREWDDSNNDSVAQVVKRGVSQMIQEYMKGLEYQMSGNEFWSWTPPKYFQMD